jgi:glycosyltransferase involved in cell wall biosynthesis
MDIGVVASHEEGLSNALIEKAAAGLPIVATDVGGNAQILRGLPNCTLVPSKDPTALARAIMQLIERLPSDLDNARLRQRTIQERYSVQAMVDAYERLYLEGRA